MVKCIRCNTGKIVKIGRGRFRCNYCKKITPSYIIKCYECKKGFLIDIGKGYYECDKCGQIIPKYIIKGGYRNK